jgi:pimeloyl-ACP methyl ester carboxylesterase
MDGNDLPGGLPYAVAGSGPPLVVLPGLSRHIEIRNARAYWPLASVARRTVYVVGRPRALNRGITMSDLAARHAIALREYFGGPVDVMGVSTGGAIALQLALDHPHAVNRLMVVAAASWLGQAGRIKLREYAKRIEQGKSGAGLLASVLAPP